jgi:hypothetical protein
MNKEASTWIIKWAVELSEYTIDFKRISAIKSQGLANFVVDWTTRTYYSGEDIGMPWVVHCDGAWCDKGVGISAIVTSPAEIVIRYAAQLVFAYDVHSTNNTNRIWSSTSSPKTDESSKSANLYHQDRLQSQSGTYWQREQSKKPYFDEVPREG